MERTARSLLPLLTLAMAGLLSCDVRVASTPAQIATTVAAAVPAADADVEAVLAHLSRHAARTALTEREMRSLSRTIVTEARSHRLDPRLVLAVVHVESRYDPYAVSDKQAMGLMQMLPSTGEWLAAQVGVVWRGPQTLFDPISNVRLGVAYLRMLLDRYDGNLSAALVAYNWGPAHVDTRLRDGVPLPADYADLVLRAYGRHT
jgi:soluble lytic murein transglycosylase